jgi:hypothetical protein
MAAGLPIRLNSPVASIRWGPLAAVPVGGSGESSGPVAVTLQSGETLEGDALVCTFSLGVLKAAAAAQSGAQPGAQPGPGLRMFDPPLPAEKVTAIERMHIGQVNKLFLEFDPPAAPPAGGNPTANGRQPASGALEEGGKGGFTPQPPPLAYSSKPHAAAPASTDGKGLVGPRRRVQAGGGSSIAAKPDPGGLAATTTPVVRGAAAAEGAAAAGPAAEVAPVDNQQAAGTSFTSYCLLWPTAPGLWGTSAAGAGARDLLPISPAWGPPPDLPAADPVYAGPPVEGGGGELPGWLYGLHSWRWSDGPEWCKPPHGSGALAPPAAQNVGDGGFTPRTRHWAAAWRDDDSGSGGWPGRNGYTAVLWVTGRAALALEALSDADISAGAAQLLASFPAVPQPAGVPAGEGAGAERRGATRAAPPAQVQARGPQRPCHDGHGRRALSTNGAPPAPKPCPCSHSKQAPHAPLLLPRCSAGHPQAPYRGRTGATGVQAPTSGGPTPTRALAPTVTPSTRWRRRWSRRPSPGRWAGRAACRRRRPKGCCALRARPQAELTRARCTAPSCPAAARRGGCWACGALRLARPAGTGLSLVLECAAALQLGWGGAAGQRWARPHVAHTHRPCPHLPHL